MPRAFAGTVTLLRLCSEMQSVSRISDPSQLMGESRAWTTRDFMHGECNHETTPFHFNMAQSNTSALIHEMKTKSTEWHPEPRKNRVTLVFTPCCAIEMNQGALSPGYHLMALLSVDRTITLLKIGWVLSWQWI